MTEYVEKQEDWMAPNGWGQRLSVQGVRYQTVCSRRDCCRCIGQFCFQRSFQLLLHIFDYLDRADIIYHHTVFDYIGILIRACNRLIILIKHSHDYTSST